MLNIKRMISVLVAIILMVPVFSLTTASAATTYQPTWASVDQHPPAPEWFQDSKFGVWFHWGPYSVPAYSYEWYPSDMYDSSNKFGIYNHHVSVYGDPYTVWPYHNFINGANDKNGVFTKFAPKLVSNGGNFDPNDWAQLFADSGAKIGGIMGEHHDGFSMWNSTVNEWNAVNKGPGLDLVGLLSTAFRQKNLKIMISNHNAFNFNGYYRNVPAQSDPSLKKLYAQLTTAQENQLWYDKLKEIVDGYQPDYIWNDFDLDKVDEQQRLNFLSYYYNKAIDWNKEVVVSYSSSASHNDGFNQNGEMVQYERGGPADIMPNYWMSEDSISPSSWSYTQGMTYYSMKSMLDELIDRVSKNGTFILNISPMADGTIPQGQKDVLLGMGSWLSKYGEAIYSTRPWVKFGEGPTVLGGGNFTTPTEGNAADIRFTRNKTNNTLYAIDLGLPSNNQMVITSLSSARMDLSTLTGVSLVGGGALTWTQDATGMKINLPSTGLDNNGFAVKMTFSGSIPQVNQYDTTFYKDNNYSGGYAVSLPPGNYTMSQLVSAGIQNDDISSLKVSNGIQVIGYEHDNFSGASVTLTANTPDLGTLNFNDKISSVKIMGFDSGMYYKFNNHASGKVLDNGGSTSDGTAIKQWSDVSSPNLEWQITSLGNGYYKIKNHASGKVLDNGGSLTDGSTIKQWSDVSSPNLEWQMIDLGNGYYKVKNHTSDKVLDNGGSTTDGTEIKQLTDGSSPNLEWSIIAVN